MCVGGGQSSSTTAALPYTHTWRALVVSLTARLLAISVWQATARLSAIRLEDSHSWKQTCGWIWHRQTQRVWEGTDVPGTAQLPASVCALTSPHCGTSPGDMLPLPAQHVPSGLWPLHR